MCDEKHTCMRNHQKDHSRIDCFRQTVHLAIVLPYFDWKSFDWTGLNCPWRWHLGLVWFSAGWERSSRREGLCWHQGSGRQRWGPGQEGRSRIQRNGGEYMSCPAMLKCCNYSTCWLYIDNEKKCLNPHNPTVSLTLKSWLPSYYTTMT